MARKSSKNQRKSNADHFQTGWRPIQLRSWWIDQVFLRRQGTRIVAHVSLVSHDNELRTQKVFPPTGDPIEAVRITAREVARLGNVNDATGVRVRWATPSAVSSQDLLEQDKGLESVFSRAFLDALHQVQDQSR